MSINKHSNELFVFTLASALGAVDVSGVRAGREHLLTDVTKEDWFLGRFR